METERLEGLSLDIEQTDKDKLKSVFPQCFVEGKLDIDMLLNLCGEYITNDFEKYKFEWKGKGEAIQLAGKRSAGTLRPCREESVDFDNTKNIYIEGDNLEVLKLLQTSYFGKVKMIYIDPPYNTGSDFVYADDFKDPLERYREVTKQTTKSNPESMGRFHTNWLNMMWPRLRLAANLLRDDGVIFISIDDHEVHNLRKLCDEIFGEEHFIADFIWRKKSTSTNVANAVVSALTDHIICYAKTDMLCINRRKTSVEDRKYPFSDEEGNYRTTIIEKKDSGDYARATMKFKILGVPPREGKRWQIGEATAREYEKKNRFILDEGTIKLKIYDFEDSDTFSANPNLLLEYGSTDSASKSVNQEIFGVAELFSNPKPLELIKHLLSLGTQTDSIVLDFFSGSATTAHAVMQLNAEGGGNRRFILVQLPELTPENSEANKVGYINICEIGKERIRRAGNKIKDENGLTATGLDIGFRVFKLDSSNLKTWDNTAILGENRVEFMQERIRNMLEILKDGRTDEDVVYEVMLRLGQDLCEPISVIVLPRNRYVFGVGAEIDFIVCIAFDITPEDAEIMTDYAPGRIIFADRCFNNSTDKSNVKLTLRDKGITIKVL